MEQGVRVSEKQFRKLAVEDPSGHWELHRGVLRQKPGMSFEHNHVMTRLFSRLDCQLDEREFEIRCNIGHLRRSSESYYIPDVHVIPAALFQAGRQRNPRSLEAYGTPLPLVVEVWSPSTGDYDVETKIPEYQQRGDLEIWRIHPFERTLTAWRRQPDGSNMETLYTEGSVQPVALPNVVIDLASLFE
jgi:Uma2 family endonuclease